MSRCLPICPVTFSRPLIGQKKECYIVVEVIEVDDLDKGNVSAASGKQCEQAELGVPHSERQVELD